MNTSSRNGPDLFLAEILEQPEALSRTLRCWLAQDFESRLAKVLPKTKVPLVVMTGMGSSLDACYPACAFLNRHGLRTVAVESGELLSSYPALCSPKNLLVVVSQSGESAEVVRLMKELDSAFVVVGVTNTADSYLAKQSTVPLLMDAGQEETVSTKTYVATLFLLLMLAYRLVGTPVRERERDFEQTIAVLRSFLAGWRPALKPLVELFRDCAYLSLIARGPSLASALEGALVLKESARRPAEAISGGQFRHGALELVSERYGYILFSGEEQTRPLIRSLGRDIVRYGGRVAFIGGEGSDAPESIPTVAFQVSNPYLMPVLEIVPVQLLAWSLANLEGRTISGFEKISKVIRNE